MKLILAGVALLAMGLASCRRGPDPGTPPLSADDLRAIAAAEEFLRQNGYTDEPHDPATLERLSRDHGQPVELVLRMRRNRTLGKAYGLSRRVGERPGWTVYFEYNPVFLRELAARFKLFRQSEEVRWPGGGMSVEVSPDLREFVVPHLDICLNAAEVVLHPLAYEFDTRPSAVEGWTVPGVDDLREVVASRLLGSSCIDHLEPDLPVCLEVYEPVSRSNLPKNPCRWEVAYPGYASAELVARLERSTRRPVLSAAECIDLPVRAPHFTLTIFPLQRRRAQDAELLIHAIIYTPDSAEPSERLQHIELEATAIMRRTGWVLSSSRVEFLELPAAESADRNTRTAGCS
jgi:hypothetical protein